MRILVITLLMATSTVLAQDVDAANLDEPASTLARDIPETELVPQWMCGARECNSGERHALSLSGPTAMILVGINILAPATFTSWLFSEIDYGLEDCFDASDNRKTRRRVAGFAVLSTAAFSILVAGIALMIRRKRAQRHALRWTSPREALGQLSRGAQITF